MAKNQSLSPFLILVFSAVVVCSNEIVAGMSPGIVGDKKNRLAKTADVDRPFWTPNRIGTYISNDGALVDHHTTGRGPVMAPPPGLRLHQETQLGTAGSENPRG